MGPEIQINFNFRRASKIWWDGFYCQRILSATYPVPMHFLGVADTFGESGEAQELIKNMVFLKIA